MYLADGSALRLTVIDASYPFLPGEDRTVGGLAVAWRAWLHEHEDELAVTEIGLTALRRAADPLGPAARQAVRELAARLTVLRVPDQAASIATLNAGVLSPFGALHLGVAVAHPDVDTLVTYQRDDARFARMYALGVVTPGRDDGWWA